MAHALLSPSAAHRWIHCTAAPLLEAKFPDEGSDFAAEGTLAHAYCAKRLKEFLGLDTAKEDAEIDELNDRYFSGEMEEYVETYVAIVLEKYAKAKARTRDAQLLVETRLDFDRFVPGSFGTADAIIIADGVLEVIDFKYGKGVMISADCNPQMMIYALGALDLFGFEYDIRRVIMTIVQPRIDNLSEYEADERDLILWAAHTLAPAAKAANAGGTAKAGEWCKFCRARKCCAELAGYSLSTMEAAKDPALLSPEDMATRVLPALPIVKAWVSDMEDYALQQALDGVRYEGYKLVEGRSARKINDHDSAREALIEAGFQPAQVLKPQELKGITELEKLVGRKRFAEICGEWLTKPQGKPTLVPDTDKREVFNAAVNDFSDLP